MKRRISRGTHGQVTRGLPASFAASPLRRMKLPPGDELHPYGHGRTGKPAAWLSNLYNAGPPPRRPSAIPPSMSCSPWSMPSGMGEAREHQKDRRERANKPTAHRQKMSKHNLELLRWGGSPSQRHSWANWSLSEEARQRFSRPTCTPPAARFLSACRSGNVSAVGRPEGVLDYNRHYHQ